MADNDFNPMSCPKCGGALVSGDGRSLTCSVCGSKYALFAEVTNDAIAPAKPDEGAPNELNGNHFAVSNANNFTAENEPVGSESPAADIMAEEIPENPAKSKKSKNHFLPIFIIIGVSLALFLLGLILNLAGSGGATVFGAVLLIITGFAECLVGFIFWGVFRHREKYTCPKCGTKREKHCQYLDSREQETNGQTYYEIKRYHRYRYTYVCPACGETLQETKEESGGSFKREHKTGRETDSRKSPHGDY